MDGTRMKIAGRPIGPGHPCFIVGEVGINHNGDPVLAREIIDACARAGVDAVKFQVGDPEKYVNRSQWMRPRETPWGVLRYIEYRRRMELAPSALYALKEHAESKGLIWFASPLEPGAVDTLEDIGVPCYKIASPMVTNTDLLRRVRETGKPVILSTGASDWSQIDAAVDALDRDRLAVLHCVSIYPCPDDKLNLKMIHTLQNRYPDLPIGYSGHEVGVYPSVKASDMGASIVERHVTLSRAMWGSDHAASLEPKGLEILVRDIRRQKDVEGDGVKHVFAEEGANLRKFRRSA